MTKHIISDVFFSDGNDREVRLFFHEAVFLSNVKKQLK